MLKDIVESLFTDFDGRNDQNFENLKFTHNSPPIFDQSVSQLRGPQMSFSPLTVWNILVRNWDELCVNFQVLVVSAVKICKQRMQTASTSGGLPPPRPPIGASPLVSTEELLSCRPPGLYPPSQMKINFAATDWKPSLPWLRRVWQSQSLTAVLYAAENMTWFKSHHDLYKITTIIIQDKNVADHLSYVKRR